MSSGDSDQSALNRIAAALERVAGKLAPVAAPGAELSDGDVFDWDATCGTFTALGPLDALPFSLLRGIDQQKTTLLENTQRFAQGLPANNVLLWGARGTGKSALVKAVHAALQGSKPALVEIHRDDLASLPALLARLRNESRRVILYCDDLSFDAGETSYKSLKAVLEGGLSGRPAHVLFYATSNRRHLMPRQMIDNERATAINPAEATEEAVSLSDRFGLWLGFHPISQQTFDDMIASYADAFELPTDNMSAAANEWTRTRGARSGRVAWQFIQDWAGRHGLMISTTPKK